MTIKDLIYFTVECTHCRHEFKQSFAGVKGGSNLFGCPACSGSIRLEVDSKAFAIIAKAADVFDETMSKFPTKLNG